MVRLTASRDHWNSPAFEETLKTDLARLGKEGLPLHAATTQGGLVDDSRLAITILERGETEAEIHVRAGLFFTETVGGCSCGDAPYETSVYCVLHIGIDKATAQADFEVVPE